MELFCEKRQQLVLNWSCFLAVIKHFVDRRAQERDKQWPEHVPQDEEPQQPRKLHDDEKLKREESVKKKDGEEKGKQEMQDKLSRLFHQHQEPAKPAVQAPWSTTGIEGKIIPENVIFRSS